MTIDENRGALDEVRTLNRYLIIRSLKNCWEDGRYRWDWVKYLDTVGEGAARCNVSYGNQIWRWDDIGSSKYTVTSNLSICRRTGYGPNPRWNGLTN